MGTSGKAMQGAAPAAETGNRELSRTVEESEGHLDPSAKPLFLGELRSTCSTKEPGSHRHVTSKSGSSCKAKAYKEDCENKACTSATQARRGNCTFLHIGCRKAAVSCQASALGPYPSDTSGFVRSGTPEVKGNCIADKTCGSECPRSDV